MGSADNVRPLRAAETPPGERLEAAGLRPLDLDYVLANDPPPRRELWHGFIGHGETAIVFGPGKSSKSLLTMALALAAAGGGSDLLGQAVEACGWVLVLDAENGQRLAHRRLRMLGVTSVHRGRLDYLNARGANLSERDTLEVLTERIARLSSEFGGPGLVVVDSVVALAAVDEWRAELVREFVDNLRNAVDEGSPDTPPAIALVAHTPHGQDRPRGTGDWVNAVDVALSVKHEGGPRYQVKVHAARDMGDHLAVQYRMVPDMAGGGSLGFVSEDTHAVDALGKEESAALAAAGFITENPSATPAAVRQALNLGDSGSAKDTASRGGVLVYLAGALLERPTSTPAALATMAKRGGMNERATEWVLNGKRWDRLLDAYRRDQFGDEDGEA